MKVFNSSGFWAAFLGTLVLLACPVGNKAPTPVAVEQVTPVPTPKPGHQDSAGEPVHEDLNETVVTEQIQKSSGMEQMVIQQQVIDEHVHDADQLNANLDVILEDLQKQKGLPQRNLYIERNGRRVPVNQQPNRVVNPPQEP